MTHDDEARPTTGPQPGLGHQWVASTQPASEETARPGFDEPPTNAAAGGPSMGLSPDGAGRPVPGSRDDARPAASETGGTEFAISGTRSAARIPTTFWVGLVVGVVGFFVRFSFVSSKQINGSVTSCTSLDMAGFLVALALAWCIWEVLRPDAEARRNAPALSVRIALALVLFVLAALHVLRGMGVILGSC